MTFIEPSAEIITTNSDKPLQFIERCARTCYQSYDKITDDSAERMVKMLLKSGHLAMIEHLVITMRLITSRGVTHELVRHRMASYAQQSTRYCDSKDMHICMPEWREKFDFNILYSQWQKGKLYLTISEENKIYTYFAFLQAIEKMYNRLLEEGATKRDDKAAHPDMQYLAKLIREKLGGYCPQLFSKECKHE